MDDFSRALKEFLQTTIGSVWALELMLTLRGDPQRIWTAAELVKELRASDTLIVGLLTRFAQLGLASPVASDRWAWRPSNRAIEELAAATAAAYEVVPLRVVRTIMDAPNRNIQLLADAFRLTRSKEPD